MSSSKETGAKGLMGWIDSRFPVIDTLEKHITRYYAPKNFNIWYVMGVLAMVVLIIQVLSGVALTMNYKPDADKAFLSVEYIMRDVDYGWLIRYMHSTGATAFFAVVYLHMWRGLLYGSYRKPRELVWLIGMVLYLLLMAEAFMGYLLPWGQMSFWGAQVIVNLFDSVPWVGKALAEWIRGDYIISDITLNRFFAFHVAAVPLLIIAFVFLHIVALHRVGSNNPDGVDIKKYKDANGVPLDGVPFHPYMTSKDYVAIAVFGIIFSAVLFFAPDGGGYFLEKPNFAEANPLQTPEHIAPVWYFTPFYAILRAIPSVDVPGLGVTQAPAVFLMFMAVLLWFFLPLLDRSPVNSIRYKGYLSKIMLFLFSVSFVVLGILGVLPTTPERVSLARLLTVVYFAYFLLMPIYTRVEVTKTPPERVTK